MESGIDTNAFARKARNYLARYFADYTFDKQTPLVHGTSSHNLPSITEKGVCPRGEERGHVWEERLASPTDRVFFAHCMDSQITNIAAGNAVEVEHKRRNADRKKAGLPEKSYAEDEKDLKRVYVVLRNPKKYQSKLVRDTDETFAYNVLENSFYNDDAVLGKVQEYWQKDWSKRPYITNEACYWQLDRDVVDVLDVAWATCGSNCVKEVAKGIPEGFFGALSFSKSFAFKGCIAPAELEIHDRHPGCKFSQKELGEKGIQEGGCPDNEERAIKANYSRKINLLVLEKEGTRAEVAGAKKSVQDYIRAKKVPGVMSTIGMGKE